jgi:hypothetical protein
MNEHWPKAVPPPPQLQEIAKAVGGTVDECAALPDGSGFATMSFPLPPHHWLYAEGDNVPPMPWRVGNEGVLYAGGPLGVKPFTRQELAADIRAAARYAIRASTLNGTETDFDPDAMVQNFVVGLLGYWTLDGLSHADDDSNSPPGGITPNPGS